ncbi:putative Zinc finger, BED-type [Corchorus olitorius]|uniref:Zinc finger, BED-type n=1 Tax=Corchorus olitorius TaxID=93759 RepID=A0A1R3HL84_9ROSI|nr:putative Zinc finger, BED-type [Corchorus olitorius]
MGEEENLSYEGDYVDDLEFDPDRVGYFDLLDICERVGYENVNEQDVGQEEEALWAENVEQMFYDVHIDGLEENGDVVEENEGIDVTEINIYVNNLGLNSDVVDEYGEDSFGEAVGADIGEGPSQCNGGNFSIFLPQPSCCKPKPRTTHRLHHEHPSSAQHSTSSMNRAAPEVECTNTSGPRPKKKKTAQCSSSASITVNINLSANPAAVSSGLNSESNAPPSGNAESSASLVFPSKESVPGAPTFVNAASKAGCGGKKNKGKSNGARNKKKRRFSMLDENGRVKSTVGERSSPASQEKFAFERLATAFFLRRDANNKFRQRMDQLKIQEEQGNLKQNTRQGNLPSKQTHNSAKPSTIDKGKNKAVNLRTIAPPRLLPQCISRNQRAALAEITDVLHDVCHVHRLPLALTWIPCKYAEGANAMDEIIKVSVKEGNKGLDGNCVLCIERTACYVNDSEMEDFVHACADCYLEEGQVAIRLRSTYTGDDNYILEFFLPINVKAISEQQLLLNNLSGTMERTSLITISEAEIVAEEPKVDDINSDEPVGNNEIEIVKEADHINKSPLSRVKRRKLTSNVWEEFHKEKDKDGDGLVKVWAICSHCKKKFDGSSKKGTTHLRNHLNRCESRGTKVMRDQELIVPDGRASENHSIGEVNSSFDQERSRMDVARMIIKHQYPLNIVEDEFFSILLKNLQPMLKLQSQEALSSDILCVYREEKGDHLDDGIIKISSSCLLDIHGLYKETSQQECRDYPLMNVTSEDSWRRTCSLVLAIAATLDPRFKFDLVEFSYNTIYGHDSAGIHLALFVILSPISSMNMQVKFTAGNLPWMILILWHHRQLLKGIQWNLSKGGTYTILKERLASFLYCQKKEKKRKASIEASEVDKYLQEPVICPEREQFDVLGWWGKHASKFPIIGRMARDILAIPLPTIISGYSSNENVIMDNPIYEGLDPQIIEAMICCQKWLESSKRN